MCREAGLPDSVQGLPKLWLPGAFVIREQTFIGHHSIKVPGANTIHRIESQKDSKHFQFHESWFWFPGNESIACALKIRGGGTGIWSAFVFISFLHLLPV